MSSLEDEIRDALRSEAGRLREVRPLRLEPGPPRRAASARLRRARLRWSWLAPVTAAALVIAVAIALVTVRTEQNGPAVPALPQSSAARATVPEYYALLYTAGPLATDAVNPESVLIGDTVTGKTLATLPPPAGTSFAAITAAADDRTFVVATISLPRGTGYFTWNAPRTWYLLRITPGAADLVQLSRLPIPPTASGHPDYALALSNSGRELALIVPGQDLNPRSGAGLTVHPKTLPDALQVWSLTTGKLLHEWHTNDLNAVELLVPGTDDNTGLTWLDGDGAIAFTTRVGESAPQATTIREFGLDSPVSADWVESSRVVWSHAPTAQPTAGGTCVSARLAVDGTTVVCLTSTPAKVNRYTEAWLAYPVAGTAAPRVLASVSSTLPPRYEAVPITLNLPGWVFWASASGDTLIVNNGVSAKGIMSLAIARYGRLAPLPPLPQPGALIDAAAS